jgi:hypothetical protein
MAHIAIISATQEQIDIEFVNNELAEAWCSLYAGQPYTLSQDPVFNLPQLPDQHMMDERFTVIADAYDQMKARGYPCDVGNMEFTQSCLNRWHRDFTTAEQHPPQGSSYEEWFAIINRINRSVHDLERYVHTPHRVWANEQFADHRDLLIWPVHTGYDRMGRWLDLVHLRDSCLGWPSDDPQAVYLNASIRGKSVLQAFLEHDDPREDDVQGHWGTWGGLTIPQTRARLDLYESEPFDRWCRQHDVDARTLPLEFCVGRVAGSTKPIDQFTARDCRYAIDVVKY